MDISYSLLVVSLRHCHLIAVFNLDSSAVCRTERFCPIHIISAKKKRSIAFFRSKKSFISDRSLSCDYCEERSGKFWSNRNKAMFQCKKVLLFSSSFCSFLIVPHVFSRVLLISQVVLQLIASPLLRHLLFSFASQLVLLGDFCKKTAGGDVRVFCFRLFFDLSGGYETRLLVRKCDLYF